MTFKIRISSWTLKNEIADLTKAELPQEGIFFRTQFICMINFIAKGGFFSESEIRFSNLQNSQKNYSKKLP